MSIPARGRASRFTIIDVRDAHVRAQLLPGVPWMRFSNVCSDQPTKPSGACLRLSFFRFFGSSPALATAMAFSISCSGAWTTT